MTTPSKPKVEPIKLELPSLSRSAIDELYQFLQFRHQVNLEPAIEAIENEIDVFDAEIARQKLGEAIPLADLKQELGIE